MNIIIYLIAGGVVGYLASLIMKTDSQQGPLLDVVVGIVGAILAGYFISPLLGIGTLNEAVTLSTGLMSVVGAVIVLGVYRMLARRA